jgi:hypothetical protein
MSKGSAFCGHKNRIKAWSCSFVQQPVSNVSFIGIKKETLVSDLPLYVHLKTEGNKTVSAEKVFRDDVLLCA